MVCRIFVIPEVPVHLNICLDQLALGRASAFCHFGFLYIRWDSMMQMEIEHFGRSVS